MSNYIFIIVRLSFFTTLCCLSTLGTVKASSGPNMPEAMQFEPIDVTDLVNLATGDFTYSIPLFAIPGPEGNFPLNLSYHSGIGPNQEATWVGLGWTLNPGAINRTVSGYPDDYNGDYVQSRVESEQISGWAIGIGISYGPVGMNMNYDSYTGNGGVNASIQSQNSMLSVSIGSNGASVGLSSSFIDSKNSSNASFGGTLNIGTGGVSAGISTRSAILGSQNFTPTIGSSVGFSLGSTGLQANGSSSPGFQPVSSSNSRGDLTQNGNYFNILGFVNISYSSWSWKLEEDYLEKSYGYLYRQEYINDPEAIELKKFERRKQQDNKLGHTPTQNKRQILYPSQDFYTVSAQGINGSFKPYYKSSLNLIDRLNENEDRYLWEDISGISTTTEKDSAEVIPIFKFINEEGNNFVSRNKLNYLDFSTYDVDFQEVLPENHPLTISPSLPVYSNIFDFNHTSRKIEPQFNKSSGGVEGFVITDIDGKIYEFLKPVFNHFSLSVDVSKKGLPTETETYNLMGTPYATTWLLTSIKGPDYLDRGDENLDSQDWGYWVKLSYSDEATSQKKAWRSPYKGFTVGASAPKSENMSAGLKDIVYLNEIETATHVAKFETSLRKDCLPALIEDTDEENNIYMYPIDYWVDNLNSRRPTVHFSFASDFYFLFNKIRDPNQKICEIIINSNFGGAKSDTFKFSKNQLLNPNSDVSIEFESGVKPITVLSFTFDRTRLLGAWPGNIKDFAKIYFSELISDSYTVNQQLDKVKLYIKGSNSNGDRVIQTADLSYDYSLCEGTDNSSASNKGKLTLKSVQIQGLDEKRSIWTLPPYLFEYDNLNPKYSINRWNNWGFYSPTSSYYDHRTTQTKSKADEARAWSLTKVIMPTGAILDIEYESDDYYYASNYFDLSIIRDYIPDSYEDLYQAYIKNGYHVPKILRDEIGPIKIHSDKETIEIPKNDQTISLLGKNRYIFIIYKKPLQISPRVLFIPRKINNIEVKTETIVIHLDQQIFKGEDGTYEDENNVFVIIPKKQVFGGGIRVKNLTSKTLLAEYSTLYEYEDSLAFSTGVSTSLPAEFGKSFFEDPRSTDWYVNNEAPNYVAATRFLLDTFNNRTRFNFLEEDWKHYCNLFNDNFTNYGAPPPGIIYSKVIVSNSSPVSTNESLNGKTEYSFYTSKDIPYEVDDSTPNDYNNLGNNKKQRIGSLIINDRSSIYGKPKSKILYTQYETASREHEFFPVQKEVYHYSFSHELHNFGYHLNLNINDYTNISSIDIDKHIQNTKISPIGLIQERSVSQFQLHSEFKDWYNDIRQINRIHNGIFSVGTTVTNYNYIGKNVDSLKLRNRSFIWNSESGKTIGIAQENDINNIEIKFNSPAFNVLGYMGMRDRNMLTQNSSEFIFKSNETSIDNIKYYQFPSRDIVYGRITTWKSWKYDIWRKNDTYIYNNEIDHANSAFSPFLNWEYDLDIYPVISEGFPWKMTSNITKYNRFSYPIEEVGIDGMYSSAIYNKAGLATAIMANAKSGEAHFFDFSNLEMLADDLAIHMEEDFLTLGGRGNPDANSVCRIRHDKRIRLPLEGLNPRRPYKLCFWAAKKDDSPNNLVFEFSDEAQTRSVLRSAVKLEPGTRWQYFELDLNIKDLTNGLISLQMYLNTAPNNADDFDHLLIDGLRIYPQDAQMKSFEYYPISQKLLSMSDENYVSSFFVYDGLGRLIQVLDQDDNLLKEHQYNYQRQ